MSFELNYAREVIMVEQKICPGFPNFYSCHGLNVRLGRDIGLKILIITSTRGKRSSTARTKVTQISGSYLTGDYVCFRV